MEQTALAGPVADVVAAFEHGETLVKKIKEKRIQNGVPLPPAPLEQCLKRGPRAIREAYETGSETYGDAFKIEQDRAALDAFRDILVNLQSTFFQHLFTAQEDDTMLDFAVVINAATMGRVKGVHVLNEMYMRMAETPTDWTGAQKSQPPPSFGSQQSPQSQQVSPNQDSYFTSPVPGFVWNERSPITNTEGNSQQYDSMGAALTSSVSASSQFSPSHTTDVPSSPTNTYTSSDGTNLTILSEDVDLAKFPAPPTKKNFRDMFSRLKSQTETTQEDSRGKSLGFRRPNSSSSDAKSLYGSSSGTSLLSGASPEVGHHSQQSGTSGTSPNKRVTNKIPMHESPPAEYRKRLNNRPRTKSAENQEPHSSRRPVLTHSKSTSRKLSLLGGSQFPKEDSAGFCEGAYLMQRGHDGMKIRNQSVSMTGQNNYWACSSSKCCFEGHAVPQKDGHKKLMFGFDEDILESHGVKYRWSFLAKSHTTISNSKAGFEYQCVFCIGRGASPFRVKGTKPFIGHVATHQGQTPNACKMPHFNYIVGRSASPWENFDVNLPAATAMELETMEAPAELEALRPRLAEMEAPLEAPLESHSNHNHLIHATQGHAHLTNGSGLGIRMGIEVASGALGTYSREMRVDPHTVDSERRPVNFGMGMQGVRSIDHQNNNNYLYHHGIHQPHNSVITDEAPLVSPGDEPINESWRHVRDSVQSLQPAPLFVRKPHPPSAHHPISPPTSPEKQQSDKTSLERGYHDTPMSHYDKSDDYEVNPYSPSGHSNGGHALRGGRIPAHTSSQIPRAAWPAVESRQASLVEAEPPHQISTPELWHPGTKWMD